MLHTRVRRTRRPRVKETKIIFSNAIGSNVFDINLGLGFPMLIFTLARGEPVSLLKDWQWVSFLICRSIRITDLLSV